jgi:hypothetical protein
MDSWKRFRYSGKRRTQHQTQNAERSVESNALVAISPEKRLVRRESFAGPVARHHNRLMILLLRIDQAQFPNHWNLYHGYPWLRRKQTSGIGRRSIFK